MRRKKMTSDGGVPNYVDAAGWAWGQGRKKMFEEGNNGVRRCMEQDKTSKGAKGVDAEEEKKIKSYSAKKYEGSVEEKRIKSTIT